MRISRSSPCRSRMRAMKPAYSSAAAGSWIEHGPAMTASRSSAPVTTSATARRPARVVAADAADNGTTVATAAGVTTTLSPVIREFTRSARPTSAACSTPSERWTPGSSSASAASICPFTRVCTSSRESAIRVATSRIWSAGMVCLLGRAHTSRRRLATSGEDALRAGGLCLEQDAPCGEVTALAELAGLVRIGPGQVQRGVEVALVVQQRDQPTERVRGGTLDEAAQIPLDPALGERVDGPDDLLGHLEGTQPVRVVAAGDVGVVAGVLDDALQDRGHLRERTVGPGRLGQRDHAVQVVVAALLVRLTLVRLHGEEVSRGHREEHATRLGRRQTWAPGSRSRRERHRGWGTGQRGPASAAVRISSDTPGVAAWAPAWMKDS